MSANVTINEVKKIEDLYCHYSCQSIAQSVYIELDCKTETLSASFNAEIGNGVPSDVCHGHTQRFYIPLLTIEATNNLMEEILPFANIVCEGYESDWNGNNNVAKFTDEASEALDTIYLLCQVDEESCDCIAEWNVADWLNNSHDVNENTSDDDLQTMIENLQIEAENQNIVLNDDIGKYLYNVRFEKRRETIDNLLDNMKMVNVYMYESDNRENPIYWVLFTNRKLALLSFDSDGDLQWKRTDSKVDCDYLNYDVIGRAYATTYFKNKYMALKYLPEGELRRKYLLKWTTGELTADNYDAAMCQDVPERYRNACKKLAIIDLNFMVQRSFNEENVEFFENKKVIEEKQKEISHIELLIADLQKQINNIKKSMPEKLETKYYSMSNDSNACKYKNLTGNYPKLNY